MHDEYSVTMNSGNIGTSERRGADLLWAIFERSDRILAKKLSNNDRDWSDNPKKHQGGVYIPHLQRDGGFFPPLVTKRRDDPGAHAIRELFVDTFWPQERVRRKSRLVNYTSKGQETHLTRLPVESFSGLMPASYMVMGRVLEQNEYSFECLTIDSDSEEATLLQDLLDLTPDFLIGEFEPAELKRREREHVLDFADEVIAAWTLGQIDDLASRHGTLPTTVELANMAQKAYMLEHDLGSLSPYKLEFPGDVLRDISRRIELELFKNYQRKKRAVELVLIVLGSNPIRMNAADVIRALIDNLPAIDALMLSASQQRKSRAGYSYEHHIETMLLHGGIPFEKQVVIQARKRPDFVLPSLAFIDSGKPEAKDGLILSAKTTLRERWKQVEREKGDRDLYLTTVDENIAGNAIEDMAAIGVKLVIPEKLKKAKESEYEGHWNVLSFKEFCEQVILKKVKRWNVPRSELFLDGY